MFLDTKETIPAGVGFTTFGATHLLWLLGFSLVLAAAIIVYRKLDSKGKNTMRIVLGSVVFLMETVKNIVAAAIGDFGIGHLPFHLCGISVLLITFDTIKPTKIVRYFLYYLGIPGALLALLFPNWTVLPCFNFFNIHSFTIHIMLTLYPVVLVVGGEFLPDIKAMFKCISLLICLAIPIYFINLLCDTNFMFLMEPETGNPLELFEKHLGNHLWGFFILLPIVMFMMYFPVLIAKKLKKNKTAEEKQEVTV